MAATYTPIASITLGATTGSIVAFTNIPQTYTDLVLIINSKSDTTNYPYMRFNNDGSSIYDRVYISGTGSAAQSGKDNGATLMYLSANAGQTTTNFNYNNVISIPGYSNATTSKVILSRANNAENGVDLVVSGWRSTAAVTSLNLGINTGNFAAGSTFNLYGIQAGNA
jgi:hypothetical protein